jgi:hypothetical protein
VTCSAQAALLALKLSETPRTKMLDFDHIEAWGPELRRELGGAIPGDVAQIITSAKPNLIEDARDILLGKVDQKVVLRLVANWLRHQTILAYHGSRLTAKEMVDVRRDGLRVLKASDREPRLRTILSVHPRWPTVERSLAEVVAAYGVNWLQNNTRRREGSVHATISRAFLIKSFNHYLKYGSDLTRWLVSDCWGTKAWSCSAVMARRSFSR